MLVRWAERVEFSSGWEVNLTGRPPSRRNCFLCPDMVCPSIWYAIGKRSTQNEASSTGQNTRVQASPIRARSPRIRRIVFDMSIELCQKRAVTPGRNYSHGTPQFPSQDAPVSESACWPSIHLAAACGRDRAWVALGCGGSCRNFKQGRAEENRQAFTIISSERQRKAVYENANTNTGC
jgi:hypothetical protein